MTFIIYEFLFLQVLPFLCLNEMQICSSTDLDTSRAWIMNNRSDVNRATTNNADKSLLRDTLLREFIVS